MPNFHFTDLFSTYSIVARDPETGALGGAVQTHQVAVGRLIPITRPGLGVVVSQSLSNRRYNSIALQMLREGIAPEQILNSLVASDPMSERRQAAVINAAGEAAAFTGSGCIRAAGHYVGDGYSVQANMMTQTTVIDAMRQAFETTTGSLAQRMLAALQAAQAEDGDIRGMQSAALKVVSGDQQQPEWESLYDLRVDESDDPVSELARLVSIRHAQLLDSVGHSLLQEGNLDEALAQWQIARDAAPDQEELAFWQAVTLADAQPRDDAIAVAVEIFKESVGNDQRRDHWLDLIERLDECGLIERAGAAEALLAAINAD